MNFFEALDFSGGRPVARFDEDSSHEKPSAHSDAAMYARIGRGDALFAEGILPRHHMLVVAIRKRAIQVEQDCRRTAFGG